MHARRASRIVGRFAALALAAGTACATPAPPPEVAVAPPAITPAPPPAPPADPPPRAPDRFAVASESVTGVEMARGALERGGSAADATVAGVLGACAAHPSSCGLGGGGLALTWDAELSRATVIDFRESAPHGIRRVDHLSKTPQEKKRGAMIGVPGLLAGLVAIHERGGRLPWASLVEPVAEACERGIPASAFAARAASWSAGWRAGDPRAAALGPLEATPQRGAVVQNAPLARALRAIAASPRALYEGPLADDVVKSARAFGSQLTRADLTEYRAITREPLRTTWGGHELLVPPLPSAGGLFVLEVLGTHDREDVAALGLDTARGVHALAETMRAAYVDRTTFVGDPAFTRVDPRTLLEPGRLAARRRAIRDDATTLPKLPSIADGGTLHFTVVDPEGDVVSVTVSVGSAFGARVVTESGFVLNDALVDFTMDDYGQRPTNRGPNFPRGGARPASSLTPTLVLREGRAVLALGGSGGLRGPTGVASVLLAHLGLDDPFPDAVARPRVHVAASGALHLDPGLADLGPDLIGRGEVIDGTSPHVGAVTGVAIARERDGLRLSPAFDPRKGGAVTVGREPAPR